MKYQKTLEQTKKRAAKFQFFKSFIASREEPAKYSFSMSFSELMEESAIKNIFYYCRQKRYQVNDFPRLGRSLVAPEDFEILRPKITNYLKVIATERDSIAELVWTYFSEFFPGRYESKEIMISIFESELAMGELYV